MKVIKDVIKKCCYKKIREGMGERDAKVNYKT
jgi:hypothetical protein